MTELSSSSTSSDTLDAAHALLGVSPKTVFHSLENSLRTKHGFTSKPPLYSASGLDALASLASSMVQHPLVSPITPSPQNTGSSLSSSCSTSEDEDYETMPPPPPRRRLRSCSNPEGMEKWDSLNQDRRHFVLPNSLLEAELAGAKVAAEKKMLDDRARQQQQQRQHRLRSNSLASLEEEDDTMDDEVDPEDVLRKARSRLLEDLSEGNLTGEKGQLTLPHALSKYKHVYNKNGRIGIYTPCERAAIIARFHKKRANRVWNKRIRYSCRKNLADRRLRVKGRFVKRDLPTVEEDMPDVDDPEAGFCPTEDMPYRRLRRHTIT